MSKDHNWCLNWFWVENMYSKGQQFVFQYWIKYEDLYRKTAEICKRRFISKNWQIWKFAASVIILNEESECSEYGTTRGIQLKVKSFQW